MLDYTVVEQSLKEDAPHCYEILKSNFGPKDKDRPIDKEILDLYRELKSEYPNGFPVTQKTLSTFWKPLLSEQFPQEAAFFGLSNLDAFTFYMGWAFLKRYQSSENKLNYREMTLACNLKNYLALKKAIIDPKIISDSNDIKTLTQISLALSNDMKSYYNTLSGEVYSLFTQYKYHLQQPNLTILPVELSSIKEEINSVEETNRRLQESPDQNYEDLKKYDLQLSQAIQHISGTVKTYYDSIATRQARLHQAQQVQQAEYQVNDENEDPTAPGSGPRP